MGDLVQMGPRPIPLTRTERMLLEGLQARDRELARMRADLEGDFTILRADLETTHNLEAGALNTTHQIAANGNDLGIIPIPEDQRAAQARGQAV